MRSPEKRWWILVLVWCSACDGSMAAPIDADVREAGTLSQDAGTHDAASLDAGREACTAFTNGAEVGRIAGPGLDELSGLAASRTQDDLLYAHNDSGDGPRVFLLDGRGAHLGTLTLDGAGARDWEDLAVGPGPDGGSFVYVGDVGDNAARTGSGTPRASITVYRVREPSVDRASAPVMLSASPEAFVFTYPDGPHDCESVAVDPETGDLYLLAKEDTDDPALYVARAPLASGVLERVGTMTLRGSATAMDLSPGGRGLLVRTYSAVRVFVRGRDEGWAEAIARPAMRLPELAEAQGEAIAWARDGRGYFTASEGVTPPLHRFDALTGCDPL
jgi:hypothetical protein